MISFIKIAFSNKRRNVKRFLTIWKKNFITVSIFKHFDSKIENIVEIDIFDKRLNEILF